MLSFSSGQKNGVTFTLVLDAGHGGKDPGCLGKNSREKDLALDVTLLTGKKIKALFPDIHLVYTRDQDVFIPLNKRASIANDVNADLFVSIHCNYAPNKPKVQGTETFVMGLHKTASNLEVVKRENAVIDYEDDKEVYEALDPNSPIGHIILENRQHANLEQSIQVASAIQNRFTHQLKRHNRGVKQAGFLVLYHTTMPSVLVELGFLSNQEEELYLMSAQGKNELANALVKSIEAYILSFAPKIQPVFPDKDPLEIPEKTDATLPISYKVQIAASRNKPLEINEINPWSNIEEYEIVTEDGLYKYLVGNYLSLVEASKEKEKLRNLGFDGAFVVAYRGMKRVAVEHEK